MLVLDLNPSESAFVMFEGQECEVVFMASRRGGVKMGFKAPPEVRIVRSSVLERDQANQKKEVA